MFLPTKPHESLIAKGQHRIRLGSRVPTDAVNLAYTHIPEVIPKENVQITDLSSSILENARNNEIEDILAVPDDSLLLRTEDGQQQLPTEEILLTNVFDGETPLYYAHTLAYYHYDHRGPNEFGMYQGEGITIVDQLGRPISRPYRVQLIPTSDWEDIYRVVIYTSFKDAESDTYSVIYNAIQVYDDGRMQTMAGHKERLSLGYAFKKVENLYEIMTQSSKNTHSPGYYQANGSSPGYSKFYVSEPSITDTRHREYFRYQIILEVVVGNETLIFTTPWFSSDVMNAKDIIEIESDEYPNGSRQITSKTAREIISEYVNLEPYNSRDIVKKFILRSNNDRVQLFTRIDGTSPIYATTSVTIDNDMRFPLRAKRTQIPQYSEGNLEFILRPIVAHPDDVQHIVFMIDHSESMKRNDPSQKIRYRIIRDLLYSARDFYRNVKMTGSIFNYGVSDFEERFVTNQDAFLHAYEQVTIHRDTTNPVVAVNEAVKKFSSISSSSHNKKSLVFITDGEFDSEDEEQEFKSAVQSLADENIYPLIITFNRFDEIRTLLKGVAASVINGLSPRLNSALRYYFFDVAGKQDATTLPVNFLFGLSPKENDKVIYHVDSSLSIPSGIDVDRYGIEVQLDAHDSISAYLVDHNDKRLLTTNGINIIPLNELVTKKNTFKVVAHSELYEWRFSPVYAVRYNDSHQIRVLLPREQSGEDSWYLRIKNGRFYQKQVDEYDKEYIYLYGIPEYYRQQFDKEKRIPYMNIKGERPKVLNEYQLQVSHTPMFVQYEKDKPLNATVWVNGKQAKIKSTRSFDGLIELEHAITRNDDILVDYQYEEDSLVYRGYYDEESGQFWSLDLNPSVGHYVTMYDTKSGEMKNVPGFSLINKTVYIYMRPISVLVKTPSGDYRNEGNVKGTTIFHTFDKVDYDPSLILLAEVRVRPNSNQQNIQVVDTRSRGGGLKPEITANVMREFEEESFHYWDIGHWDGQPYSENAVVTFRISRSVLKEYGGRFTRADVEEKIHKHLGFGVFPIIEFTEDSDYLLEIPQNLNADVLTIEDEGDVSVERPTFELSEEV